MSRVELTHPRSQATIETPTTGILVQGRCLSSDLLCCIIIFSNSSRDSGLSAINFGILAFDKFHSFEPFLGDAQH